MHVPIEYEGREQSFLKHRVLSEYLRLWGHKIGSLSRREALRLWYVDCFAGPWRSKNEKLSDTSIDIGLRALEEARQTWRDRGHNVALKAVFVEKEREPFRRLTDYLRKRVGEVETFPLRGEFGEHIEHIVHLVGEDPAFVFVDPTGFKGVAMRFITPLVRPRIRDVLVNVMFNDINRFKNDAREFLREQMKAFFGLKEDLPRGLSEPDLLRMYRHNLKQTCGLPYAADLAIPHPTKERTWFRLVIGGRSPTVLRVFRDVEAHVVGREASIVRDAARARAEESSTGQLQLGSLMSAPQDPWYQRENELATTSALDAMNHLLASGPREFRSLWPSVLEEHHLTHTELARVVVAAASRRELLVTPPPGRRQKARESDLISLIP